MSENNMSKKEIKKYRQDIITFKMSCVFILAFAAIISILKFSGTHTELAFWKLCRNPIYIGIISALLILSLVWFISNKKKKVDESLRTISSINFVAVIAYVFLISMYYLLSKRFNAKLILAATVILALLYFIYYIYKKDFFVFTAANAIFAVSLYLFSVSGVSGVIFKILALCASIAACIYNYNTFKNDIKGNEKMKKTYYLTYFSFLITVFLIVFSNVFSLISSFTCWIVLIAQFAAAAIFYTIKLIKGA